MQKIRVIDFETTGLPESEPRGICEIGYTDLSADWNIGPTISSLVNPGHPIPPQTRAIHHISDDDVADAIDPNEARRILMDGMGEDDIFAAHNAKFEQAFFGGGGRRWICTMQCAKHLFPDAPGHSNQVLRYWLGIDEEFDDADRSMPPHRSGPDTFVTAHILARLVFASNVDELVRLTTAPVLLRDVTIGKHRGMKWADLPWDYLNWVATKSDFGADEKYTARHYLGARK